VRRSGLRGHGRPRFARECWFFATFSWIFLFATLVSAAPKVELELSSDLVGVGQTIRVRASIVEEEGQPEPRSPQLKVQGKAQISRPSTGSARSFVMNGFSMKSETKSQASWRVSPLEPGQLVVGPATFMVGGQRVSSDKVVIRVTDQPQAPPSPFDLLRQRRRHTQMPQAPKEYELQHAADPTAFLHARLSRRRAVLGEPIRLTILAYGARGDFSEHMPKVPSLGDFVSHSLIDNSEAEPPYQTRIDGRTYVVRKVLEFVLIPLKTGRLDIGPMSVVIQGNVRHTYPAQGHPQGFRIESLPLSVEIVAAPEKGKPQGYFAGDVGRYKLDATVSPREVTQGEYVEVLINVSGEGQIPSQVILPESADLVWEEPTLRGGPEIRDGKLQGTRSIKYTVQVNKVGTLKLGEVRLPHFDARSGRYRDVKAQLGSIRVKPAKQAAAKVQASPSAPAKEEVEERAPPMSPRERLGEAPKGGSSPATWMWLALLGLPLGSWGASASYRTLRGALGQRSARGVDATKELLNEAKAHAKDSAKAPMLASLERALFEAITRSTGIRARGLLRNQVAKALVETTVPEDLAEKTQQALLDLESDRYGGAGGEEPKQWIARIEALVKALPADKFSTNEDVS